MLDGIQFGAVDERGEIQAAGDRAAVDQDGAAAAQALAAALARPEQAELLLQHVDQVVMRRDLGGNGVAIEGEADRARLAHWSSSSGLPAFVRNARNTASGVSGNSVSRTPTASSSALAIAGETQKVETSPTPLPPNGPFD